MSSDQRAPYWAADTASPLCIWAPMGEPGAAEAPNWVFISCRGLQISSRSALRLSAATAGPVNRTQAVAMVLRNRRIARQQWPSLSTRLLANAAAPNLRGSAQPSNPTRSVWRWSWPESRSTRQSAAAFAKGQQSPESWAACGQSRVNRPKAGP